MNSVNAEGLEEGEIEDEIEEKERNAESAEKSLLRRNQDIRPNCDSERVHSRTTYQSKSAKRNGEKFKKTFSRPSRVKTETTLGNREWPKTFVYRMKDATLPGRCRPPAWEGPCRSPPRLDAQVERHPWPRSLQYSRSRMIRPRPPRPPASNKRNSSHDEMSYEDLLAQYKEIQSQLEELNRQDSIPYSTHQTEDETLNKENLKNETRRKHIRNEERHTRGKTDKNLTYNAKNRRRSRTRSVSSSRTQVLDEKSNQEEDDEQELRRIALASTRARLGLKGSENQKDIESEEKLQTPLQSASEFLDNVNQQMFDNYEEVEMELDSNCESVKDESDDEEELRKNVLLSLNQKHPKDTSAKEMAPKQVSCEKPTDSSVSLQLDQKEIINDIPQAQIIPTPKISPPVHKRVVINLAEDSSDSEQDENHSISVDVSRFLKEARQLADAQQAVSRLSDAQVEEYCRLKVEIAKREQLSKTVQSSSEEGVTTVSSQCRIEQEKTYHPKIATSEDEKELTLLKNTLIQKKKLLVMAEQKVKRLQEQLAAAQKVVAANKTSMIKINSQIKVIQKKINDQKSECLNLKPKGNQIVANNRKRQLSSHPLQNNFKRTRLSPRTKINVQKGSPNLMTAKERADEKARLQRLEQEISAKLQELRRAKGIQQLPKPNLKEEVTALPLPDAATQNTKLVPSDKDLKDSSSPSSNPLSEKEITDIKKFQDINLKNILNANVATCRTVSQSKWDFLYFPVLPKLSPLNVEYNDISPSDKSMEYLEKNEILSPLLHLKSSRLLHSFSGHFSSSTYANKIDPNWKLCSYDLMGTCNDDNCPRQHARDYSIKPEEIIADLVSYCPQLCGLSHDASFEPSKDTIRKYAEEIFQKTSNHVSLEEICAQVVHEIRHHVPAGERLKVSPRPWKIEQDRRNKSGTNSKDEFNSLCHAAWDLDSIASEDNTRYFYMDNYQTEVLEAKLLEEPNNIQLWLKYASCYYNRKDGLSKANLDRALHILSSALESNQSSEDLWLQYLSLYRQHPDSGDFAQLCQQALTFVSSYELWWKYLNYTRDFKAKIEICKQIISFVKNCQLPKETSSHRLLEIYLYRTQLMLQMDYLDEGIKLFQEVLENHSENKFLTGEDLCVAWLVLVHLNLFRVLPSLLLDTTNDNPGHLVNKAPILIMWKLCLSESEQGLTLLNKAIDQCSKLDIPLINIIPLYKNIVALHLANKSFHLAEEVCQELIKLFPSEDSWILLATVYFQKSDYSGCLTTLQTAVNYLSQSPRIHFLGAIVAQQFISNETAREWLTRSIRNLLNTDQGDPETLYRHILALPQSINIQLPSVSLPPFSKDEPFFMYLWLSYCVLLQIEFRQNVIPDVLEIALARITSCEPLQNVWLYYLHSFAKNLLTTASKTDIRHWASLIRRCLITIPTQIKLDNDFYYLKEFHVEIAEMLIDHVTPNHILSVLATLHSWLPKNSSLFLGYLKSLMKEENYQTVVSLVSEAIGSNIKIVDSSRLVIYAAQNVLPVDQICNFYGKLTSAIPYSVKLWEDALLSLEVLGLHEEADRLRKCACSYLDESLVTRLHNFPKENQVVLSKLSRMDPPSRS